jgi:hypothetical protein
MWICPLCERKFVNTNQRHSCNDKELADFLYNKSKHTVDLFWNFIRQYEEIGTITINPTKSAIALAADLRIAYIIQLGRNFIDVVFAFQEPYHDNLCFRKIAQVPGTSQYNHHLRIMTSDDVNDEVKRFMKLAYQTGKKS